MKKRTLRLLVMKSNVLGENVRQGTLPYVWIMKKKQNEQKSTHYYTLFNFLSGNTIISIADELLVQI